MLDNPNAHRGDPLQVAMKAMRARQQDSQAIVDRNTLLSGEFRLKPRPLPLNRLT